MTPQEAEVLAAKLTRIWAVSTHFVVDVSTAGGRFVAPLSPDIELHVSVLDGGSSIYTLHEIGSHYPFLYCYGDDRATPQPFIPKVGGDTPAEVLLHRQSEWMPLFRRNCWLSGCPIEASAHEIAEWMRGFTREEIEAWNLKI